MKTNLKLKKAIKLRSEQDNLRIKALNKGVDLIAPETIFLSKDTKFGKNVKIEPYVVIGSKVKIGNILIVRYTPAATIVAACIIALAGVGPAIASGSQI